MERLLQEFEQLVTDRDGETYRVMVYGRSRPADTWQGWLVFERLSDGSQFETDVETTQPSAEAIRYWATGLTDAYFDGALERAKRYPDFGLGVTLPARPTMAMLERGVLTCFNLHRMTRLLTQTIFDEIGYSHADIVRALEDLEKQGGLLVRRTDEGNDFVYLTARGAEAAGLQHLVSHPAGNQPPRTPTR